MASVGEENVAGSETNGASPSSPPPRQWERFLRDVEWFDRLTALATFSIAVLTAFYVYYTHQELEAIRTQFHLDHRPWVVVSKSRLSVEPVTNAKFRST
jgi:hypothetical protein